MRSRKLGRDSALEQDEMLHVSNARSYTFEDRGREITEEIRSLSSRKDEGNDAEVSGDCPLELGKKEFGKPDSKVLTEGSDHCKSNEEVESEGVVDGKIENAKVDDEKENAPEIPPYDPMPVPVIEEPSSPEPEPRPANTKTFPSPQYRVHVPPGIGAEKACLPSWFSFSSFRDKNNPM